MAENESKDRSQNTTNQHLVSPLSKAVSFLPHGPIPTTRQTMPEEQEQQHQQRLSSLCNGFLDKAPKLQTPEGSLRNIDNGRGNVKAVSPRVTASSGQNGFPHKFSSELASEQDVPLDFSLRRRESTSESLSDDSRASSTASPKNFMPSSSLAAESRDSHFHYYSPSQRQNYLNQGDLNNDRHIRNSSEARRSPCSSPESEQPIGHLTRTSSVPGVTGGRFDASPEQTDKTSLAVRTPAAAAAVFGQNGSILGSISNLSAALIMDPRRLQSGNGRKMQRPFKAYPKEALQMPIGYLGQPNFSSFAGMDHNPMQGLTVSQEELVSIYKQQLDLLKERDKQLLNVNKPLSGSISSPSSTSPSASSNGSTHSAQQLPPSHATSHSNQAVPSLVHPLHPTSTPSLFTSAPTSASPAIPVGTSHSGMMSNISSIGQFTPPSTHSLVSSTSSNSGMRKRPRTLPEEQKDEAYWERRRKNNDAAKRSRDARRAKEDEIAIRAALLEQENLKLRVEVAALKTETARLRCMLYNS